MNQEQEECMKSMKVNDNIYKIRGNKIMKDRGEEMFAMFDKEGKLHETKQEDLNVNRIFGFQLLVVFLHLEVKSNQILGQQNISCVFI